MEYTTIASNGQWTLHKAKDENDYKSYRTTQGQLPQDFGNKGELHNVGTVRSPKSNSKDKMKGKVPQPVSSHYADIHAGIGQ